MLQGRHYFPYDKDSRENSVCVCVFVWALSPRVVCDAGVTDFRRHSTVTALEEAGDTFRTSLRYTTHAWSGISSQSLMSAVQDNV